MNASESEPDSPPGVDETAELVPGPGPSTVVGEIRDVDFPVVRRGYDRDSVDAFVARVTQLVAELDATRSPQQAVKRALERVGEETASILRQAQQTAQQMMARSEARAREREQQVEREARRIKADAQAAVRRLDEDTDRIWEERQRLIDDSRKLADLMLRVADDAEERFPSEPADGADQLAAGEAERPIEDSTDEVPGAAGAPAQEADEIAPVQAPSADGPGQGDPPAPPASAPPTGPPPPSASARPTGSAPPPGPAPPPG